jgi:tetratricopeptide (TPR) repeat protein
MIGRMRTWPLVVALVSTVAWSDEARHSSFLNISQLMKLMEASKTKYEIRSLDALDLARGTLADSTWRQAIGANERPRVVNEGGTISVIDWEQSAELQAALVKADEAYAKKDYAEAEKRFRAAVALSPGDPRAHAYLGDALLFGGKPTAAKVEYDRAIELNPFDYRYFFFRASAWRELKQPANEKADLRTSLMLKPRNARLLGAVNERRLGVHAEPDVLVPQSFAREEKNAIVIYADPQRLGWFAWASCKAAWLGEASHRKAATGSEAHHWTSTEELECLSALLAGYARERKDGGPSDPRLEQLNAIADEGLGTGLVLYEMGSRIDPQITLRFGPEAQKLVRTYVEKYVLPDVKAEPPNPGDAGE